MVLTMVLSASQTV